MTIRIPLKSDYSYTFSTSLDQTTYIFRMNWVEKEDAWYIDIYDGTNNPLILGHKLLYNNSVLIKYHANSEVPQGEFLLTKGLSGELDRPTFDSISNGDVFYYTPPDELVI